MNKIKHYKELGNVEEYDSFDDFDEDSDSMPLYIIVDGYLYIKKGMAEE